jgi:hypothetical protein
VTFAAATARANAAVFRHLVTHDAVLDSVAVSGIFDNGYSQVLAGVGGGIGVQNPSFTLPSADCTSTTQGSSLIVSDQGPYTVQDIEPDGTGITVLRLSEAAA